MTLKSRLTLILIVAGLSLGAAACTSSASTATLVSTTPPPTLTSAPASDTPLPPTDTLSPTETALPPTATEPLGSPTPLPSARVMVKLLNVRAGPGTAYPVVAIVKEGDVLTALGRTPDSLWIVVRLADGTSGWCSAQSKYVTLSGGISELPAAPIPAPPWPTAARSPTAPTPEP